MSKKILIRSSIFALLICFLLLFGGQYLLDYSLKPEALKESRNVEQSFLKAFQDYPFLVEWTDSLLQSGRMGDLYIENKEGTRLHAYTIPAEVPTGNTAVLVHGYTDNAVSMLHIAHLYNKVLGFNVLMPDLYAHGLSEGEAIRMGWKDRLNVLQWAQEAEELFGGDKPVKMVIHGVSMGGATTLMAAGEIGYDFYQLPYVKAIVADCAYTTVWDEFAHQLKEQFSLPAFPLLHIANALCKWEYGWDFKQASAIEGISNTILPVMLIHGTDDNYVPTRMLYQLEKNCLLESERYLVNGAGHAKAYETNPEKYTERVESFINKHFYPQEPNFLLDFQTDAAYGSR